MSVRVIGKGTVREFESRTRFMGVLMTRVFESTIEEFRKSNECVLEKINKDGDNKRAIEQLLNADVNEG